MGNFARFSNVGKKKWISVVGWQYVDDYTAKR